MRLAPLLLLLACGAPPAPLDTSPVWVTMLYSLSARGDAAPETCIPPPVQLPTFRWEAAMRSLPCDFVFVGRWTADCRRLGVVPPGAGATECYWEPL